VGKHTWPKTHPTNPTRGVKEAKNTVLDGANLCRVTYPTLPDNTRHGPPFVGWCRVLSGEVPDKDFCDEEGHKPPLEGGLSGLSGGFSGGL
jgi:DNA polymerase-1